jgi:DNA-binding response OmpR family regulator
MPSILLLEPDAFLAGIYGRKFEVAGFTVTTVEKFTEAKKQLKKKLPDAFCLEPEDDVEEALRLVRSLKKKTTLFIFTKLHDRAMVNRFTAAGAAAYFIKGHFVPKEIVAKVQQYLNL